MESIFLFELIPKCKLTPSRLKILNDGASRIPENLSSNYNTEQILEHIEQYQDFDNNNEIGLLFKDNAEYYVSGGMSRGDSPTEAFDIICVLSEIFEEKLEQWAREDYSVLFSGG
jgi:hypothetical protein